MHRAITIVVRMISTSSKTKKLCIPQDLSVNALPVLCTRVSEVKLYTESQKEDGTDYCEVVGVWATSL